MMFEWIADPSAWVGLATLVLLEIVLGIDNLVFIAILADKLPPSQRNKARLLGLSLALIMRLGLLASISWIVTLTQPLFTVYGFGFSGRDLILLIGGLFLMFKGTMELHERLEGAEGPKEGKVVHAVFWQVIVQIVVLDAVFSLDSVITAVGMISHLSVMMIAVVVAMAVMMAASKPLMAFVSRHPTVVILCLGFLMMIGFSLIVEGFGFHIPKGYLYAAIGFSILIEAFNQVARRNRERITSTSDLRERTANAVLSLIGGRSAEQGLGETADVVADRGAVKQIFAPEEKDMIHGVLTLAERPVKSIMTPRPDIDWLDLDSPKDELRAEILSMGHSRFLLAHGSLDQFIGVALARDLMRDLMEEGQINLERSVRQPLVVHESVKVLRLMEQLRQSPLQVAVVLDEYGSLEGIATPTDILEAIAGEFPDEDEDYVTVERGEDGSWLVEGWLDIRRISNIIGVDLVDEADRYSTLAGYILWQLGHLPTEGERVIKGDLVVEVVSMQGRSIDKVRLHFENTDGEGA
ncbi:TerC family protein [Rhodospirillum rubrum]|uniref:Integral membrane protein TerC n=1 Tax=Rhodospirillum rubrum (strain ATCC 11170 / ATH 1.1.1 / DSM 467 / LMG 4362 / NCIMB 8255 / S1) TaxID=269796 RepID=Q2RQC8_RHORT|nr:TerC family protein [Rhodospirillum rubrum]ABC23667.1 integral membrane protein TerC [Rhodospirillum rubrum ATCC 11170]AEO49405.1 integral membrane protein TerC [Rhodospirillum rubrum F11]MBK5955343.1 TerC family protein [Rhodospirillum rubrum]QXG79627.1 TerC family protein [Rhodospirillum rubrum]HAP98684.1 TerC family protein [Rhodospirillum rubrum]